MPRQKDPASAGETDPKAGASPGWETSPDSGAPATGETSIDSGAPATGEVSPDGDALPELRGLYRHVKISVLTLDIIIVAGILAIAVLVLWSASNGGYLVRFDARGGSDVEALRVMYGETVTEPEAPDRNGYTFGGWYADEGYSLPWDFAHDRVEGDLTLYARWDPAP